LKAGSVAQKADRTVFVVCAVLWLAFIGLTGYEKGLRDGVAQLARECPKAQQGERLVSSEQRPDGTVYCSYTFSAYGGAIRTRKASPPAFRD
jgi:hypothetical protein